MRFLNLRSGLSLLLIIQFLPICGISAQSAPQQTPLGALRASGEVFVNGSPVAGDLSIFAGDILRTGANGAAGLSFAGRGVITVAAQSEVSLAPSARYFAQLQRGTVSVHWIEGAQPFQIEASQHIVAPTAGSEAVAEIVRAADGSVRITCLSGSVGVLGLESAAALFLQPGQSAQISAGGVLTLAVPPAAPPPAPTPQKPSPRKPTPSKVPIILIAAGGGAAAVAALALAKGKASQPTSPFVP